MVEELNARVREMCERFSEESGVGVTSPTVQLASQIVSAIVEDPHPQWMYQSEKELRPIVTSYVSAIPMMLYQVAATQEVRDRRITAFDFLHWFSESFPAMMCVIPKG